MFVYVLYILYAIAFYIFSSISLLFMKKAMLAAPSGTNQGNRYIEYFKTKTKKEGEEIT